MGNSSEIHRGKCADTSDGECDGVFGAHAYYDSHGESAVSIAENGRAGTTKETSCTHTHNSDKVNVQGRRSTSF